jgi:hypothetical protein
VSSTTALRRERCMEGVIRREAFAPLMSLMGRRGVCNELVHRDMNNMACTIALVTSTSS